MEKQMEAHLHEQFKLWSFVVLCQSQSRMQGGKREESNMKKFKRMETVGHILSTSRSPFHAYYISFPSSGSQESNSSNGVQIGVETMKLWPFVDNRAKLSELSCENFAGCFAAAKHPFGTRVPFRSCKMGCKMAAKSPFCREITSKLRIKLQIIFKLRNHLQVAKSQIQLAKWRLSACKNFTRHAPTCEIHLCNLRYLLLTKLDFFSRYFV